MKAEAGGAALPFRQWMQDALFDPDSGYYTKHVRTVGGRGDFATSATTGSLLGEAIAGWLKKESSALPEVRAVIEVGGGDGSLSRQVRRSLGWWRRRKLRWHMVEASPVLRSQQEARVGRSAAVWHDSMKQALGAADGSAFIFHNELVDAFPVTLLQWNDQDQSWREVWVLPKPGGAWTEEPRETQLTLHDLQSHGTLLPQQWPPHALKDGQRVELHTSYRDWLQSWAPDWREGAMLTLDYGEAFPEVYRRRPRGTLRAYFMHQRLAGAEIYERMGRQDLTADVNFSDLRHWGEELGWRRTTLETQAAFLQRHVTDATARAVQDAAARFLLDGAGAGSAFKVLTQRPGPAASV